MTGIVGMSASTGARIDGLEHLRQSVRNILQTPRGSRVMRRDYGSRVFEYVDAPTNAKYNADIYQAIAVALRRWEPRVAVKKITLSKPKPGMVIISLDLFLLLKNGMRVAFGIENVALHGREAV